MTLGHWGAVPGCGNLSNKIRLYHRPQPCDTAVQELVSQVAPMVQLIHLK